MVHVQQLQGNKISELNAFFFPTLEKTHVTLVYSIHLFPILYFYRKQINAKLQELCDFNSWMYKGFPILRQIYARHCIVLTSANNTVQKHSNKE